MSRRASRRCACQGCYGSGTWLDYARTMERFNSGKHHEAAFICTKHCRKEYPGLIPPPARQLRLPRLARYRAKAGLEFQYVPLDRPAPA